MKSFICSSITLGLAGSSVITCLVLNYRLSVLALTPEQIFQKLNQMPVRTIGNSKEILLSVDNHKKIFVTYMSHQDAQQVAEPITKENPKSKVEVMTILLGMVYELLKSQYKSKAQKPPDLFTFIPFKKQLSSALSILKKESPRSRNFTKIPLFYGMIKSNRQENFLSVKDGEKNFTPFYFQRESLQRLIKNIRLQQPKFASSIKVKGTPLGGIVSAF
jgi:Tic22-like family